MSNRKKSRQERVLDEMEKIEDALKEINDKYREDMERLESQCREVALTNQEQKRLLKKLVKHVQEDCIKVHAHAEAIFDRHKHLVTQSIAMICDAERAIDHMCNILERKEGLSYEESHQRRWAMTTWQRRWHDDVGFAAVDLRKVHGFLKSNKETCIKESDLQRDIIQVILNLKDHVVSELEVFI
jgi:DNA repair exonuclease SbcCD ATPase subunit